MTFPYTIIDLSHNLSSDTPSWDLDCGFHITDTISYEDCDTSVKFKIQSMAMPAGIGTHIDAPAHCIPNAASVSDLNIETHHLLTECIVIDVSEQVNQHYLIDSEDIFQYEKKYAKIPENSFVIFYTGWERYWNTEKYRNNLQFPSVSQDAAELVIQRQVAGIGIDTLSPDLPTSEYPVHQTLLGNGKFIVENIANANKLPKTGAIILILPLKILNATEAPVRAIGLIHI